MKTDEYEKEVKILYRMAVEQKEVGLALTILEQARINGIENMKENKND